MLTWLQGVGSNPTKRVCLSQASRRRMNRPQSTTEEVHKEFGHGGCIASRQVLRLPSVRCSQLPRNQEIIQEKDLPRHQRYSQAAWHSAFQPPFGAVGDFGHVERGRGGDGNEHEDLHHGLCSVRSAPGCAASPHWLRVFETDVDAVSAILEEEAMRRAWLSSFRREEFKICTRRHARRERHQQ